VIEFAARPRFPVRHTGKLKQLKDMPIILKKTVKYDKELRYYRAVMLILAITILLGAVAHGVKHRWLDVVCNCLWATACLTWRSGIKNQQKTRDEIRVMTAAVRGSLEQEQRRYEK
jgi:uncharacterized membrane protein YjjP (DUF1212 family)